MDLFEYFTNNRDGDFVLHWGQAGEGYISSSSRCQNLPFQCDIDGGTWIRHGSFPINKAADEPDYIFGIEWTPRGYRLFKNYVFEPETVVQPPIVIIFGQQTQQFQQVSPMVVGNGGQWVFKDKPQRYLREYRNYGFYHPHNTGLYGYGDYLDLSEVEDSLLQKGISHTPQYIQIAKAGGDTAEPAPVMRIDYVRVYQPKNQYADMEPVFR